MDIVFMGTPDFSVPALAALIKAGHRIKAVYTQPPRPAGRGQKEKLSSVHIYANEENIPIFTPKTLRDEEVQKEFIELEADAAVVVAYGQILPEAILNAFSLGCLNIHASLLPRWRGAAPIQRAIMAGDKKTGITIIQMDASLDTGDMLMIEEVDIAETMSAGQLHDILSEVGARLIVATLDSLPKGDLKSVKQNDKEANYAAKIVKEEAQIDWNKNAEEVSRMIRAFNPFPGAFCFYSGQKIKIFEVEWENKKHDGVAGMVIDEDGTIACGKGVIRPIRVQRQGKNAMGMDTFLRGNPIPVETILG